MRHHVGLVVCPACRQEVHGTIGEKGDIPLLHILETGKSCPGVGQMQEVPLMKLALFYAFMSWVSLRRIARVRFRLPIW